MEIPSSPQWYEWKQHPQTQEFLAFLRQSVLVSQEAWLNSEYLSDDRYKSEVLNVAAMATAQTILKIQLQIENIKFSEDENAQ